MLLFSLDTSFSFFNFTLIEDGKVLLHHFVNTEKKTLELLPSELKRWGIELDKISAFAVSVGVGYLTSLRIGITFTKTLAYLAKKPVFAYENLELMCRYVKALEPKVCLLKVSNNLFYRTCQDNHISPVKMVSSLREVPEGNLITLKLQALGGYELEYFPFSLYGGLWAYEKLKEGHQGENIMLLEPIYLKPP
ncbi:MAG: tRNA (adenosine(37)-N6)-threonylcarbamoyltransferase complex dimerization subunit type 1 TsaB [Aquificota bacterium]|nr:MAG: tRNA (adenosine(37)-N6)-threonylcarbamoyltransferase complex dimerization subunit type 1 TsaB [Aquificota bacterium]